MSRLNLEGLSPKFGVEQSSAFCDACDQSASNFKPPMPYKICSPLLRRVDEECFVDSGDVWRVLGSLLEDIVYLKQKPVPGRSPESRCVSLVALAARGVVDACHWDHEWHENLIKKRSI